MGIYEKVLVFYGFITPNKSIVNDLPSDWYKSYEKEVCVFIPSTLKENSFNKFFYDVFTRNEVNSGYASINKFYEHINITSSLLNFTEEDNNTLKDLIKSHNINDHEVGIWVVNDTWCSIDYPPSSYLWGKVQLINLDTTHELTKSTETKQKNKSWKWLNCFF